MEKIKEFRRLTRAEAAALRLAFANGALRHREKISLTQAAGFAFTTHCKRRRHEARRVLVAIQNEAFDELLRPLREAIEAERHAASSVSPSPEIVLA